MRGNKKGESIVETVVAMLIIVMAVLAFFGMVSFALRMYRTAEAADDRYYAPIDAGLDRPGDVTVDGKFASVTVKSNGELEYYVLSAEEP